MPYLSDFKHQECKKHRTASRRMTTWANLSRDLIRWHKQKIDCRWDITIVLFFKNFEKDTGSNFQFNRAGIFMRVSKSTPHNDIAVQPPSHNCTPASNTFKVLRPPCHNYWKNVEWIPYVFCKEYCSECQNNWVIGQNLAPLHFVISKSSFFP